MCSAHVVSAISRGRSMRMRKWTLVSGMEARACFVCLAWASFGLRDVHVKTNGYFWSSMNAIHECMRISAAAARRRVEASTREKTLISVRYFPPRHSVCTSNLAVVFGVSSVGRVHVKLDRRFRHVCPFLICMWPRKCCTCQNSAVVFDTHASLLMRQVGCIPASGVITCYS